MGFFPTSPNDGDEIGPNTNGTYFKYVAADNKWIIISNITISDIAYNEGTWNSNPDAATKNVLRDKFESIGAGVVSDTAFGASWNGITTIAPSKNAVYDVIHYHNDYIIYLKTGCTVTQIQTAIDTLSTAGGGIVQLPRGTINIGTTTLNMKDNIWLRGVGYSTILSYSGTTRSIYCNNVDNWRISNLKIYNMSSGNGIEYNVCNDGEVDHIWFKSNNITTGYAFLKTDLTYSYHISLHHCKFETWLYGFRNYHTVYDFTKWHIRVMNCTFYDIDPTNGQVGNFQRCNGLIFSNNFIYITGPCGFAVVRFRRCTTSLITNNQCYFLTTKPARWFLADEGHYAILSHNILIGYTTYGYSNNTAGGISTDNIQVA